MTCAAAPSSASRTAASLCEPVRTAAVLVSAAKKRTGGLVVEFRCCKSRPARPAVDPSRRSADVPVRRRARVASALSCGRTRRPGEAEVVSAARSPPPFEPQRCSRTAPGRAHPASRTLLRRCPPAHRLIKDENHCEY